MKKDEQDKYFFTDEEFFEGVEEPILSQESVPTASLDILSRLADDPIRDGFFLVEPGDDRFLEEASILLETVYPHLALTPGDALEEISRIQTDESIFIVRLVEDELIGMIGARPTHGSTGYELFPHVVDPTEQNQGLGTVLLYMLEKELAKRGATVLFLATEDEFGDTTLYDTDLFAEPFEPMRTMKAVNWHPFVFYRRRGFQVCGVIPDAFGVGKPDILMAKKIQP
jgi:aminoglycoside 6'-N-acetyltransferase I